MQPEGVQLRPRPRTIPRQRQRQRPSPVMAESDPLTALKSTILSKQPITYCTSSGTSCASGPTATHLSLSGRAFAKNSTTRYRSSGASSGSDFYTLDAVYLAWTLRDAPAAEYMKQMREGGLTAGFVSVTERKNVVEWLEGRVGDGSRVVPLGAADSTTPPGSPARASGQSQTPGTSISTSSRPTARTNASQPSHSLTSTSSPTKRKYVVDERDLETVKKIRLGEVELRDRTTVLRGVKVNNFASVRAAFNERLKKLREAARTGSTTASSSQDPKTLARKARNNQPIIMISSSPTALITMHNVKRFLQESLFEPSQDARARAASEGNTKAEDLIPIYRKRTTIDSSGKEIESQAKYLVVDSVEALMKLGSDAWDRVVCVMTTGQEWQFRQYKWKEPLSLFHHVKGIYVTWSNDPPNPKIKDWNVTELKIDPYRRHVDKSVVAHFWKILDTWISINKASLLK